MKKQYRFRIHIAFMEQKDNLYKLKIALEQS
jgi:hypothetical protein